jgi:serine/threonine-protein kinase
MTAPDVDLAPDATFSRYRLVRRIGEGGMGAVWEATELEGGARVAIKVLPKEVALDATVRARFEREGEVASRIKHPHVIEIKDYGTWEGTPFMVMELLDGEDLGTLLDRVRPLPQSQLADVLVPVCAAVGAAHEAGVIHRDIKPENVFLAQREGGVIPKLLDFGISKVATALAGGHDLTRTSSLLGTPYYMSPEQIRGAKHVEARTDVYALGVLLYECATGTRPYEQTNLYDLVVAIMSGTAKPPAEANDKLAPELDAIIRKAMSKAVDDRPANAFQLGKELLPFASEAVRAEWAPIFDKAPTGPIETTKDDEERDPRLKTPAPRVATPIAQRVDSAVVRAAESVRGDAPTVAAGAPGGSSDPARSATAEPSRVPEPKPSAPVDAPKLATAPEAAPQAAMVAASAGTPMIAWIAIAAVALLGLALLIFGLAKR